MSPVRKKVLILVGAALMLVGTVTPFVASAQQAGMQDTSTAATPTTKQGAQQKKAGYLAQLATNLGISEQKLREGMVQTRIQIVAARLAPVLGLTFEQTQAELKGGRTIAQIASDHGKSRADVRSALLSAQSTRLDNAVQKGRITADEANQRRQPFAQHVDKLLDRNFQQLVRGKQR